MKIRKIFLFCAEDGGEDRMRHTQKSRKLPEKKIKRIFFSFPYKEEGKVFLFIWKK
jgi:hypothetical protein